MAVDGGLSPVDRERALDHRDREERGRPDNGEQAGEAPHATGQVHQGGEEHHAQQCAGRLQPGTEEQDGVVADADVGHLGRAGVQRRQRRCRAEVDAECDDAEEAAGGRPDPDPCIRGRLPGRCHLR